MTPHAWQLLLAAELTPKTSRALCRGLGSSRSDPRAYLLDHPLLSPKEKARVRESRTDLLERALERGVRVVSEAQYPEALVNAPGAPPALFADGDFMAASEPTLGIVGTRNATAYGKGVAEKFARAFAERGGTVVSGGALGIDAAAHKGALAVGGRTIAVLAGGIDQVYPAVHAGLFRQIREAGCLVSQFAVGSRPNGYKFLLRNGTIAALSRALLVVEAPRRSGALVTAQAAAILGRPVYVVPANIGQASFAGSHALIRDGATLVDDPEQLLEEFDLGPAPSHAPRVAPEGSAAQILAALSVVPLAPEFIAERTGLEMPEVMSELTLLELDGWVTHDAGGYALKP